jgi:ABC-type glycerol-3-phosphate transport system substrate-binding protein
MQDLARASWAIVATLLFGVAILLLAACELPSAQPTAPPTTTPVVSDETPIPQPASPVADATPPGPSVITLTVWTTEAFSPTQVITSGQILAQQVVAFEESHSGVRIQFVLKKPYGKGGVLDFLMTTGAVVPDLLPDLVVIDVDELGVAVQAGLVQPLDDLIPLDLIGDLYPFARAAGTYDGRLAGLQFQTDLDHLVYNTGQISIPPRSWPGVLSNPGPYVFPAGGKAGLVNDAFLIQYMAVRAQPAAGSSEDPFLEADSLAAVFQFYRDGVSRGIFPADIVDYNTTDDCWRDYLAGQAILTQVSAHRYLADRGQLPNAAVAPIPAINGPGAAISRGWVLALAATDTTRQSAAVAFMVQLMSAEVNAAWNQAAGYLPTRQAALAEWDEADSYTRFVQQQLQGAQPRPRLSNYTQVAAALQDAVEGVLSGALTPEEAAAQAIENIQ